jgi:hypothetical protein
MQMAMRVYPESGVGLGRPPTAAGSSRATGLGDRIVPL